MKVAIDTSPLKTGHKVRGIGSYTQKLVEKFKGGEWDELEFEYFEDSSSPPPANVIHYPFFDIFFKTLPNKAPAKTARVVTIHDVIPLVFPSYFPAGPRGFINFFFQKRALKNTDFIICDSRASKRDIAEKLSYPEDRIKVIYLAAGENFIKIKDQNKLKNVTKKFKLPREFALYVGDVNWNKNLKGVVSAVKLAKVNLVMVGSALTDSSLPQVQALNRLIKKNDLESKVTKTGFTTEEELIALYNLATVTVLPSFYEGFGLPVLESMACGTPVVCSQAASLAEIAGESAYFCNPEDPSDIANKITKAFSLSKKERDALSTQLIKHAATFSWDKVAKETIKVYQEAAARK